MDWGKSEQHSDYVELALGAAIVLFVIGNLVVLGIIGVLSRVISIFDMYALGDIMTGPGEMLFGGGLFFALLYFILEVPKNPVIWYIHFRNLEVEHVSLECREEYDEFARWVDENIEGQWINIPNTRKYKFAKETDAMAFKLKWA